MNRLWQFGLALATSVVLFGAASAQDIVVGVAGPMTGNEGSFGRQLRNGAEQAIADLNAAGGLLARNSSLRSATMPAIPSKRSRLAKSSPA